MILCPSRNRAKIQGRIQLRSLGHGFEIEVIASTCTTIGYALYTCRDCGFNHKDNYVSLLGDAITGLSS
ncbi:MAG: hypothetical protein LBP79_04445 [Clostridiales bacterium]|nr:hypothetical protein [Clostridiales bacterium]